MWCLLVGEALWVMITVSTTKLVTETASQVHVYLVSVADQCLFDYYTQPQQPNLFRVHPYNRLFYIGHVNCNKLSSLATVHVLFC